MRSIIRYATVKPKRTLIMKPGTLNLLSTHLIRWFKAGLFILLLSISAFAQVPPSEIEKSTYQGLFAATAIGDLDRVVAILGEGASVEQRDSYGRTPLHVAAYAGHHEIMRSLVAAGSDPNSLENDRYDVVTIAAVANDVATLQVSLALGASPANITSIYNGTALIAAAHLGNVKIVQILIRAEAPLDHVNNLGWTALIESIVLGDGGFNHIETLRALIDAGADVNLADRQGRTPLDLAIALGFSEMVRLLKVAGAH